MQYFSGVDGGGTKTTAVVSTSDGVLLSKGTSGPSNYQVVGLEEALDNIVESINIAVKLAEIENEKVTTACFGLSGVGRPVDHQIMGTALRKLNIAERIILDHDAAIALAGAFACQPGVIVIAGTGATAFGINESGDRQRAGGWGSILGDEGSGYYIGQKALVCACRAHDGRGEKTILVQKLVEQLNLSCLTDLVKRVYVDEMKRREIASLASLVFDAAREGDGVARDILKDAGKELGIAANAVITKLKMRDKKVQVATAGGIFEAGELIVSPFRRTIQEIAPNVQIVHPKFQPVIGAVFIALRETGIELNSRLLDSVEKSVPQEKELVDIENMVTEKQNIKTLDIDKKTTEEIVRIINEEDKKVAPAVEKEIPNIATAIELIVNSLRNGGRLFYIGAGTSGRLGIIDAAECPPTFGTEPELVQGIIAGGDKAIFRAQEGAEDNLKMGGEDLMLRELSSSDVVVGLSTSGRTPYVIGALEKAKSIGCKTIAIGCNPNSEISKHADVSISPIVGPEVITGSTRMKAGTAEKMVLNMLSTTTMIKLGKVSGNLMTDISTASNKLMERGKKIIMSIAEVDYEVASKMLKKAKGHVKVAVVMIKVGVTYEQATKLLEEVDGSLEKALLKGAKTDERKSE